MNPETDHPTFEQLVAFSDGHLEPAATGPIQAHLAAGCPTCQADLAWLSHTLTSLQDNQWQTPPPALSAAARHIFQNRPPAATTRRPFLSWLQTLFQPAPRRTLAWASLLLVALISSLLLWNQTPTGRAVAAVDWQGYAEMQPADAFGWQPAASRSLRPGEWMRTGEGANADLSLFDHSTVHLGSETEVAVAALDNGQPALAVLLLQYGTLSAGVSQDSLASLQLVVSTPATVASSEQGNFSVQVEPDGTTLVIVYEGSVQAVAQGLTVTAHSGQTINVLPGKPPVILGSNAMAALPGRLFF